MCCFCGYKHLVLILECVVQKIKKRDVKWNKIQKYDSIFLWFCKNLCRHINLVVYHIMSGCGKFWILDLIIEWSYNWSREFMYFLIIRVPSRRRTWWSCPVSGPLFKIAPSKSSNKTAPAICSSIFHCLLTTVVVGVFYIGSTKLFAWDAPKSYVIIFAFLGNDLLAVYRCFLVLRLHVSTQKYR